ncbi:hypothetical protein ACFQ0B_03265 [Nonomuraea thailandensis]
MNEAFWYGGTSPVLIGPTCGPRSPELLKSGISGSTTIGSACCTSTGMSA